MSVLTRKLWRTIKSTKGQFLAVAAVVTVGITVYIAMSTAYYNLNRSQAAFTRKTTSPTIIFTWSGRPSR